MPIIIGIGLSHFNLLDQIKYFATFAGNARRVVRITVGHGRRRAQHGTHMMGEQMRDTLVRGHNL